MNRDLLFNLLPMPLALIRESGSHDINDAFSQRFPPQVLASDALAAIIANPGLSWRPVQLDSLHAGRVSVMAQAVRSPQGILLLISDHGTTGTHPEISRLQSLIGELEKAVATDFLTGAWNRSHFERIIQSEMSRSTRFQQPLSAIMFDIDHFKRVNDSYGHQVGDLVLKELVSVTLDNIRSADMLFRWGGEEFVVLAVSTGYQSAAAVAEHLRKQVAAHRFGIVGSMTASFGVAEHTAGESVEHWLSRVDAALYTAKTGGRNRVVTDRRGESDTWQSGAGLSVLRLVWHDNYDSGNAQIDEEHRELFALCNNLIAAFGHDSEQKAALDQLLAHIARHFRHEEQILQDHHYGRFTEHQAAHKALLKKAADLKKASDNGNIRFSHLINFLVNDVVARHLFTADHDYFSLFAGTAVNNRQNSTH